MYGDSNCLIYLNLIFDKVTPTAHRFFITHARYWRGVRAENFTDSEGTLHREVVRSFLVEGMLTGTEAEWKPFDKVAASNPAHSHNFPDWIHAEKGFRPRPLTFFIGWADFVELLIRLGPDADFHFSSPLFDESRFPSRASTNPIPHRVVRSLVARTVEPLFRGLEVLSAIGWKHLYLHSLHPPTLDDEGFYRLRAIRSHAALRYKLVLLINELYAEFCSRTDVRFLNRWGATTLDGVLDPKFHLDHDHLNKHAALDTVAALIEDVESTYR